MKEWMQRERITVSQVARETNRSREWVSRLANGKEQPSEGFITDFFFAFGQEATVLAFDVERAA